MKKNKLLRLISTIVLAIMMFGCQNEAAPSVTERIVYVDRTSDAGNIPPTTIPDGNTGNKITSLQVLLDSDDVKNGDTIDLSQYQITNYNATVNKAVTIKNANMQGDTLKVTSGGVVLENVSKAAVNTNSSLKISSSSLSSLSIGNVTNGRGELLYSLNTGRGDDQAIVVELEGATVVRDADLDIAGASIVTDATADIENIEVKKTGAIKGNAANIRIAGSKIKLEVTDLSADKVTFVGNNTTLDVMNKESSIKNVETDEDVICQLEMEEGLYANMNNPTVRGENGKLTRVDKTKDATLSNLSINQNPTKIAYAIDETLDLTGLEIVETYSTSGIKEFTQEWKDGHLVETYTRLEANPLTNTAYSFTMKTQDVPAIGYKFKEADKGENVIQITKTVDETEISTEALKVVVLKDDEYAISYGGIDPQDITDYNLPRFYKKSNTISLNTSLTKTGFVFAGWYEDNNKGPITGWAANTKEGSVSLYARWINMLYVDPDLTDDVGYGSYDKPFKTIERAIAAITSTGSYTIVLKKDIVSYGKISFKNNFPVNITIQPEEGSAYIKGYEYLMFEDNFEQTKNIALTMKNISFDGEIDASNSKSLILENVNIGNGIRCGQALFTNVTSGDVTSAAATFTDVTIDGDFNGTDISFSNVLVTKGAYFEEGSLTQVRINGYVTCDSAVFSNAELGQMSCNGDVTFKNVTLTAEVRSLIAGGDINLGGELSFAGKIDLAAGKKIILTDRIATDNPIVLALTSAEQKDQIIDGRSDYVSADGNKFIIDGTAWYLKNGQLRRYWYVDGTNGDDNNLGSEDHPLKTVHKAVESSIAESIIYVRGDTSEDGCMDILYDTEIYPWGYVDDETWTGGHTVIQRNCFGENYYKSFIKVHENVKFKARYFEFNGNGRFVVVPMSHAAGITVAGGDIDIKHCIISRFSSSPFDDDDVVGCGGPGGLSVYNNNETEKTIILEDITIDSCHGYTMALAVGNFGYDDGHLTVEIGNNVNIIGGKFEITENLRPETDYLPAVIRLDGLYSKLTLTKDIKLNTYFEDGNTNYKKNHLIDISAGIFTIDNCTLTLPEKPATNNTNILVNGIYIHKMRTEYPIIHYKGNVTIESYDDVAVKMEGHFTKLISGNSSNSDTFHIVSKNTNKKGTGLEAIGVYHSCIDGLYISGFDTGVRYFVSEEYFGEFVPYLKKIENCNVAIEVGNGSQSGNINLYSVNPAMLKNNTYDVKFNNTDGNKLTLGNYNSSSGLTEKKLLIDFNNETVMKGIINIDNITKDSSINLVFVNIPNQTIDNVFRLNTDLKAYILNGTPAGYEPNTANDLSADVVITKFTVLSDSYSLIPGKQEDIEYVPYQKKNSQTSIMDTLYLPVDHISIKKKPNP